MRRWEEKLAPGRRAELNHPESATGDAAFREIVLRRLDALETAVGDGALHRHECSIERLQSEATSTASRLERLDRWQRETQTKVASCCSSEDLARAHKQLREKFDGLSTQIHDLTQKLRILPEVQGPSARPLPRPPDCLPQAPTPWGRQTRKRTMPRALPPPINYSFVL